MARRRLTPSAEAGLVAEAVAARDSDATQLRPAAVRVGNPATVVFSVRLSAEDARAIRDLAAERGMPLGETLATAIRAFAGTTKPTMSVKRSVRRVFVQGVGSPSSDTIDFDGSTVQMTRSSSNELVAATA